MLNLDKIDRIASLSLENAFRLHEDSILLYGRRRYPAAFFLSVLAQEEVGKMHIATDFTWHSRIEGRMTSDMEERWLKGLYQHPRKQGSFLRNSPLNYYRPKALKLMEEIFDGTLERKKQESVYVGLKRERGTIDVKGKIRHPFQITSRRAQSQITKVNDYLLVMGLGIVNEFYSLDGTPVEDLFTKRMLRAFATKWKPRSRDAAARICSMHEQSGEAII
ncbi:MAG TPA: AbiV family abortive infection protein [Pyrinomonadaceae bacterium]